MNNKGLLASIAFLTCLIVSAILMRPTKFGDLASGSTSELALNKSHSNAQIVDQYCVVCHNGTLKTGGLELDKYCLLYTSPSPRDAHESRMPSSA